ncbi:MAG: dTDP-4-dehydrorhamnose 3,5-epimerase [Armatimonadota bacterium]|nr:dTDP-4-dehydrorhamnose 3,5-epimerase [Armatimonadota bacterium]
MLFVETDLVGAFVIKLERRSDERGFFARTWCEREFAAAGLCTRFVQANVSRTRRRGTVRGMHYQVAPFAEAKLIRCTRGAVYDVIIDLRPESPSHRRWAAMELSADDSLMLYVPEGFAHGFQTLEDDSEVVYQVSQFYTPQAERGVRYDDPAFGIVWPLEVTVISEKDRSWPDYLERPAMSQPASRGSKDG